MRAIRTISFLLLRNKSHIQICHSHLIRSTKPEIETNSKFLPLKHHKDFSWPRRVFITLQKDFSTLNNVLLGLHPVISILLKDFSPLPKDFFIPPNVLLMLYKDISTLHNVFSTLHKVLSRLHKAISTLRKFFSILHKDYLRLRKDFSTLHKVYLRLRKDIFTLHNVFLKLRKEVGSIKMIDKNFLWV